MKHFVKSTTISLRKYDRRFFINGLDLLLALTFELDLLHGQITSLNLACFKTHTKC